MHFRRSLKYGISFRQISGINLQVTSGLVNKGLSVTTLPTQDYCCEFSLELENIHEKNAHEAAGQDDSKSGQNSFTGFIPVDDLKITYSCSSGPGGQNVNRIKTKVDLRYV